MKLRVLILLICFGLWSVPGPVLAGADDRPVRLYVPEVLIETGLLRHVLPRFSLKTQVQVEIVAAGIADIALGASGQALFEGAGQVWSMAVQTHDHAGTTRFADWLTSEVGRRTITSFAPNGTALFTLSSVSSTAEAEVEFDGNQALGRQVSRTKCIRCHSVDDDTQLAGIGSTPSFAVLRSLSNWQDRFATFYVRNPHPSFTIIANLTAPFPRDRPPPIAPITLTLDELENVLAYVGAMQAADLGAPLIHQ